MDEGGEDDDVDDYVCGAPVMVMDESDFSYLCQIDKPH